MKKRDFIRRSMAITYPFLAYFVRSGMLEIQDAIDNMQGAVSIRKTVFPGMAITMLKIRRPSGRLIFNMEIAKRR